MTKTLNEFIVELQALAREYGDDISVQTDEGEDPEALYSDDDPDDPCVLVG